MQYKYQDEHKANGVSTARVDVRPVSGDGTGASVNQ